MNKNLHCSILLILLFWSSKAFSQHYAFDYEVISLTKYSTSADFDPDSTTEFQSSVLFNSQDPQVSLIFIQRKEKDYEAVLMDGKYKLMHFFNLIRDEDRSVTGFDYLSSSTTSKFKDLSINVKLIAHKDDVTDILVQTGHDYYQNVSIRVEESEQDLLHFLRLSEVPSERKAIIGLLHKVLKSDHRYMVKEYTVKASGKAFTHVKNEINAVKISVTLPDTKRLRKLMSKK